jgi:hypothetical protein
LKAPYSRANNASIGFLKGEKRGLTLKQDSPIYHCIVRVPGPGSWKAWRLKIFHSIKPPGFQASQLSSLLFYKEKS